MRVSIAMEVVNKVKTEGLENCSKCVGAVSGIVKDGLGNRQVHYWKLDQGSLFVSLNRFIEAFTKNKGRQGSHPETYTYWFYIFTTKL